MSSIARFLGDSPVRVLVKLLVVSFVVGMVMNYFGWSPFDIVERLYDLVIGIWNMGFEAIERSAGYVLLGAVIVIPAFLLIRLLSYRR